MHLLETLNITAISLMLLLSIVYVLGWNLWYAFKVGISKTDAGIKAIGALLLHFIIGNVYATKLAVEMQNHDIAIKGTVFLSLSIFVSVLIIVILHKSGEKLTESS